MKKWQFFTLAVGGLFVAGLGAGFFAGVVNDEDGAPILYPILGAVIFLVGVAMLWFAARNKVADTEDVSDIDMFMGDMSDPVQRGIIMRVAVAGAIHGITLLRFVDGDAGTVIAGDGPLTRAEWFTIASYVVFTLTLVWMVIECIIFHNIDEFWRRVAMGPTALAGVILFLAVVLWTLAEQVFGAPEARFWWYYALFYFSGLFLLIGKWQKDKARG